MLFKEYLGACLLAASLLAGCTSPPPGAGRATPLPTGYMLTAVALTLQASGLDPGGSSSVEDPSTPAAITTGLVPTASGQPPLDSIHLAGTATLPSVPVTPSPASTDPMLLFTPPATQTPTAVPSIAQAHIQIFQVGELSRVASPLKVFARLYSEVGKVVRVELHGEDGRLLGRELTTFHTLPWHVGTINTEMPFEIRLAAELGRLVISVEDVYGRLMDVNSVNLILLGMGRSDLNPATALLQVIQIDEPKPQTLIQGGSLVVSGLARPNGSDPLRIELIGRDGQVLGQRLAAVVIPAPGEYGTFAAEVPYQVSAVTPVRLVVYESGGALSAIAHLASVEVMLSP